MISIFKDRSRGVQGSRRIRVERGQPAEIYIRFIKKKIDLKIIKTCIE